jgi:prepilin signal peptidase PulO-like enzyme (type II secretory pathway)
MSPIDIFTWIVLLIIVTTVLGILAWMGTWPGKVARARRHPYVDAITVGSWLALIFGGLLWPLIVIWAHATPSEASVEPPS